MVNCPGRLTAKATKETPMIQRRGLMTRLALLSIAGAAGAGGLVAALPATAQAQTAYPYPPVPGMRIEPPPPPPPGAGFIWEPGHWRWNGYRYDWHAGHYVPRGVHHAHFVPGHWAPRYGRWVWVPQHWQ
jgi:WXXGXW repeat (2 copies)